MLHYFRYENSYPFQLENFQICLFRILIAFHVSFILCNSEEMDGKVLADTIEDYSNIPST